MRLVEGLAEWIGARGKRGGDRSVRGEECDLLKKRRLAQMRAEKFGYHRVVRAVVRQAAAHRFEQRVARGQRHGQFGPGGLRHAQHFLTQREARLASGFHHDDRGDRHGHKGYRQDQPQADLPCQRAVVARAAQLLWRGSDGGNHHSDPFDDHRSRQPFHEQRRNKPGSRPSA